MASSGKGNKKPQMNGNDDKKKRPLNDREQQEELMRNAGSEKHGPVNVPSSSVMADKRTCLLKLKNVPLRPIKSTGKNTVRPADKPVSDDFIRECDALTISDDGFVSFPTVRKAKEYVELAARNPTKVFPHTKFLIKNQVTTELLVAIKAVAPHIRALKVVSTVGKATAKQTSFLNWGNIFLVIAPMVRLESLELSGLHFYHTKNGNNDDKPPEMKSLRSVSIARIYGHVVPKEADQFARIIGTVFSAAPNLNKIILDIEGCSMAPFLTALQQVAGLEILEFGKDFALSEFHFAQLLVAPKPFSLKSLSLPRLAIQTGTLLVEFLKAHAETLEFLQLKIILPRGEQLSPVMFPVFHRLLELDIDIWNWKADQQPFPFARRKDGCEFPVVQNLTTSAEFLKHYTL